MEVRHCDSNACLDLQLCKMLGVGCWTTTVLICCFRLHCYSRLNSQVLRSGTNRGLWRGLSAMGVLRCGCCRSLNLHLLRCSDRCLDLSVLDQLCCDFSPLFLTCRCGGVLSCCDCCPDFLVSFVLCCDFSPLFLTCRCGGVVSCCDCCPDFLVSFVLCCDC